MQASLFIVGEGDLLISIFVIFLMLHGFLIIIPVWRSASNYEGYRRWAIIARIAVIMAFARKVLDILNAIKQLQ